MSKYSKLIEKLSPDLRMGNPVDLACELDDLCVEGAEAIKELEKDNKYYRKLLIDTTRQLNVSLIDAAPSAAEATMKQLVEAQNNQRQLQAEVKKLLDITVVEDRGMGRKSYHIDAVECIPIIDAIAKNVY